MRTSAVVAYTDTAARSSQLTVGKNYVVCASTDCWISQGGSSVDAAVDTANSIFLAKGVFLTIRVESGSDYISAVRSSSSGTLVIVTLE